VRLIFLDFDGVLNSDIYFASPAFLAATRGLTDAQMMLDDRRYHLDPEKLALVNRLVEVSGARVVVSSSWRLMYSLDELGELLASRGATFRPFAATPRVTEYEPARPLRAREILAYLGALESPPEAMVALDDDNIGAFVPFHVQTDGAAGLLPGHVDACLRLLGGEP